LLEVFKKQNNTNNNTKKFNVAFNFFHGSSRNLGRCCNRWGRGGGRAGSSYELDAAQSIQSKFFFHILDLLGGFLWKA
jgi:hypothetical protein